MRFARPLVAGVLLAGSFATTAPALATCVGEHSVFYVCATTPTVDPGSKEYCFYLASSQCTPVTGPDPRVSGDVGYTCSSGIAFTWSELPRTPCHLLPPL